MKKELPGVDTLLLTNARRGCSPLTQICKLQLKDGTSLVCKQRTHSSCILCQMSIVRKTYAHDLSLILASH